MRPAIRGPACRNVPRVRSIPAPYNKKCHFGGLNFSLAVEARPRPYSFSPEGIGLTLRSADQSFALLDHLALLGDQC